MRIKILNCQTNCQRVSEAIRLAGHEVATGDHYDAIYTSTFNPIIASGIPTIIDFATFDDPNEVVKLKEGLSLYNNVVSVRVPSLQCKTMLLTEDLEANKKIVIRPWGYDASEWNMAQRSSQPNHKFLLAIVQNSSHPNGIIAEVLKSFSKETIDDMVISFIVGSDFDEPVMYNADVVLAASKNFHPWSTVTLQCMACGAFPLVTDTEGIKMILHNDGIGNVFSNDVDSIRQNILMAYTSWKQSPAFINNLGRKASKVARKYNWNKFVDLLVEDLNYLKEEA